MDFVEIEALISIKNRPFGDQRPKKKIHTLNENVLTLYFNYINI